MKLNKILFDKYKDMNENRDFEQNFYSRTSTGAYKIGLDSIRILKCSSY